MRRFHCDPLPALHGLVTLGGDARRHAVVLRLAAKDAVVLFDGHGHEAEARIVELGDMLVCRVESLREAAPPTVRKVVLVQCLAKGEKLDEIVRGATEAGVAEIRLATAKRDVAKWKPDKLERLQRVAREASRQSGRATVPEIFPPLPLSEVAALAPPSVLRILLVPGASSPLVAALRKESGGEDRETWLVVGSEGGVEEPLEGWARASIGPYVFRTEHAGMIAVAIATGA